MKYTDLMCGDWVKIGNPNKYEGAIGKICTLSSQEGAYFTINIYDPNFGYLLEDVFCEDLQPIPLTAEILEKNGFEYHGVLSLHEWNFKQGNAEISLYTSEIDKNIGGFHLTLYTNDKDIPAMSLSLDMRVFYVHELQHALKLCGIEKEVVL